MRALPALRAGRDADAPAIIALIGACWAEYPGCVMDMERENHELLALGTYYAERGGALWVAEGQGALAGMVATCPLADGTWELCKMYVSGAARGAGLAQALVATAEAHARAGGATRMALWTDTRFTRAHRFYEKLGYLRDGPIRALDDLSHSIEFAYAKPLAGRHVARLDAAAAASAVPALAALLVACVDAGASVSFLAPLAAARAAGYWQLVARQVATGHRALLAAWQDGDLVGTAMLDLDMPPNQPHRAEVKKLLVHPGARRQGLARALMDRIEFEARAGHRSLLTLDTRSGDAAEHLYRAAGWQEGGRIPGFTRSADGSTDGTTIFWKTV